MQEVTFMYEELKKKVYEANMLLPAYKLITFTWGNVSEIDRSKNCIAIKPSGVEYDEMQPEDMVVLDLDGNVLDGRLNPSSDTPTHLELYRSFKDIKGVVHTHSPWATTWAQAGRSIKAYGTTHGDYFYGSIPCTRKMYDEEIEKNYELNTGKVIVETFSDLNPNHMPAVLVNSHGPFTWGTSAQNAVHNAVVLEELAKMGYYTEQLGNTQSMQSKLLDKHYMRKHGTNAYYGQKKR